MPLRAAIVVTGTEVLSGQVTDRNGPWVSERLGELGIEVSHIVCTGDRRDDLEATLCWLEATGVHLIVTTGGLGPTADDVTVEAVARFAERELVLDEEMEAKIATILEGFAKRFRFDPEALREANRKQATVPRDAATVDPVGTAPGVVVEARDVVVVVLPGPPRELQGMWEAALAAPAARALLERAEPFQQRSLRLFGIPESEIAKTLRIVGAELDLSPLEITTCLRRAELEVDIRHRAGGAAACEALVEAIRRAHGRFLYSEDGSSLDDQVAGLLEGRRIAVGESCTGGLLAARLTERPGASAYVAGGVVAYSNEAKSALLDVPESLIAEHGAVSPQVAEAMADGAIARFEAELGIGVTGIAGPGGGSDDKPVGYVCVCVKQASGGSTARDPVLPGDRDEIRDRTTTVALHMLRRLLVGEELPV